MNIKWRYQQDTPNAGRWTSPEVFEGELRHAMQGVMAGHLLGQPRAAIEEGTGRVVYALDAQGRPTAAAVALFGTVELAGTSKSDRARPAPPWAQAGEGAAARPRPRP